MHKLFLRDFVRSNRRLLAAIASAPMVSRYSKKAFLNYMFFPLGPSISQILTPKIELSKSSAIHVMHRFYSFSQTCVDSV